MFSLKCCCPNHKAFCLNNHFIFKAGASAVPLALPPPPSSSSYAYVSFKSQCLRLSGNKIHYAPRDQTLRVKYFTEHIFSVCTGISSYFSLIHDPCEKKNFVPQYRPINHLTKTYLCNFVNDFQKIVSISLGGEIPR